MVDAKICTHCLRINPLEAESCVDCNKKEFDELCFTPPPAWDSIEAYKEETNPPLG